MYHTDLILKLHMSMHSVSLEWKIEFYAFLPFSLIGRIIQKISIKTSTGILIVPNRPTQLWYSHLMKILIDTPILLPSRKNVLLHPTLTVHPIWKRLDLLVCLVSGKNILTQKFRNNQLTYLQKAVAHKRLNDTNHISKSGSSFDVNKTIIPFAWM